MSDPMAMFDCDADWHEKYDFEQFNLTQKIDFLEMVFDRQRTLVEKLYCVHCQHFQLFKYQDVYQRCFVEILVGLKGQMNFYEFAIFLVSFFQR